MEHLKLRQVKPLPAELQLAPTLCRRVLQLRELRNLTVRDLSRLARFPHARIEDIEAGLESWLSSTDRQRLAKALCVEPLILQEVETRPALQEPARQAAAAAYLSRAILEGAQDLQCPDCGQNLQLSVQEGFDFDGLPIRFAKAFCLRCPFVLR